MDRINPFGDLDDFAPKARRGSRPVETATIDTLSEQHGFPSREATRAPAHTPVAVTAQTTAAPHVQETVVSPPRRVRAPAPTPAVIPSERVASHAPTAVVPTPRRRYTTGRNQQINVKATAETIARFYRLADARGVPLGELLDQALMALENRVKKGQEGL